MSARTDIEHDAYCKLQEVRPEGRNYLMPPFEDSAMNMARRNRRLAKDFKRLIETSTATAMLAIIQLLTRRLASC